MTLLMDDTAMLPSPGPLRAAMDGLHHATRHRDDSWPWQGGSRVLIDSHPPIGEHEQRDAGHGRLLERLIAVYGERRP